MCEKPYIMSKSLSICYTERELDVWVNTTDDVEVYATLHLCAPAFWCSVTFESCIIQLHSVGNL
jgi:hypothetical protein